MSKIRGYAAEIAKVLNESPGDDETDSLPDTGGEQKRTGVLHSRQEALSRLSQKKEFETFYWVDPKECRPSPVNARDYAKLNRENCADVIESILAEGRQHFPAVVRRTGDTEVPYEIVSGLRRHFSISWLNANNYPNFKYLITIKDMDDESAWRLSDLENRSRRDITDYERAVSYAAALHKYYGGSTAIMAKRVHSSARNIRRYLQLAEIDPVVIAAFGGEEVVRVNHATSLAKLIGRSEAFKATVLEAAKVIAKEQEDLRIAGNSPIPASTVLRRFAEACQRVAQDQEKLKAVTHIAARSGRPMIELSPVRRSGVTIKVLRNSGASLDELLTEMTKIITENYEKL